MALKLSQNLLPLLAHNNSEESIEFYKFKRFTTVGNEQMRLLHNELWDLYNEIVNPPLLRRIFIGISSKEIYDKVVAKKAKLFEMTQTYDSHLNLIANLNQSLIATKQKCTKNADECRIKRDKLKITYDSSQEMYSDEQSHYKAILTQTKIETEKFEEAATELNDYNKKRERFKEDDVETILEFPFFYFFILRGLLSNSVADYAISTYGLILYAKTKYAETKRKLFSEVFEKEKEKHHALKKEIKEKREELEHAEEECRNQDFKILIFQQLIKNGCIFQNSLRKLQQYLDDIISIYKVFNLSPILKSPRLIKREEDKLIEEMTKILKDAVNHIYTYEAHE